MIGLARGCGDGVKKGVTISTLYLLGEKGRRERRVISGFESRII
jgi:hypothetical protein